MRSDNRLIEDTAALPVDPTKVPVGNFRSAPNGVADEVIKRRTALTTTIRGRSAFASPVEAPTGVDLSGASTGAALVKDAVTGKFSLAGANAPDVFFLERVFNRGATQFARAVPNRDACLIVARAVGAIASGAPLKVAAAGELTAAAGGENVVAIAEMAVVVAGAIVVTTGKWQA